MSYRYPRAAAAGFVDGKLAAFKRYVDVYWDLVPPPPKTGVLPTIETASLDLLGLGWFLKGDVDATDYWNRLHSLKKRAFYPTKRPWGKEGEPRRDMTKEEFWEHLRERAIKLALTDKNIWKP